MQLNTADLEDRDLHLEFGVNPDRIPALAALHTKGEVHIEAPLSVALHALRSGDMIAVKGRFSCRVEMACARCLRRHHQSLDSDFELSYLQAGEGGADPRTDKDGELDAREAGLIHFQGNTVDLAEGLGEQVIMELPYKPLCDPDCMGLCSSCGKNLNQGRCRCNTDMGENPFAVLKAWQGDRTER
jgi:uncharacterized protein